MLNKFSSFHVASSQNARVANSVSDSSHGRRKGMVLPFEPHSITFDEIVYSVDMPPVKFITRLNI